MIRHLTWTATALALLSLTSHLARADLVYNVTLDTSVLASNASQGPFAVDFELNDGSTGDGVNNNTATISTFTLTGGSLTSGTSSSTGSVSGDLSSTLTITDNGFFNDFNQQFSPGSQLRFTLDLTTNVSTSEAGLGSNPGAPDQFSFTVYSNNFASTASLLTIDITGPNPVVTTSGGSLGNGVSVAGPTVTSVPEPSTFALSSWALGLMVTGVVLRRAVSGGRR